MDGRARTYLVHAPSTRDHQRKMALVLVLHGATQSPEGIERMSGMSALADREGFLAAYPRGTGRLPTWNAGNCCAYAAYRLACELSERVAAIAPVEGAQNVDCHRSHPVSVIVFHGTADRLVPFHGGATPFQLGGRRTDIPSWAPWRTGRAKTAADPPRRATTLPCARPSIPVASMERA